MPPSIKDHGSESLSVVNVREGTSVSLECESNAVPPPVITWYKNGQMITESTHLEILADGQTLHIKKAEVHLLFLFVCHDSVVGLWKKELVVACSLYYSEERVLFKNSIINAIDLSFIFVLIKKQDCRRQLEWGIGA